MPHRLKFLVIGAALLAAWASAHVATGPALDEMAATLEERWR